MELDPKWKPDVPVTEAPAFTPVGESAPATGKLFPANVGKGRKILVVDDNAVVLKGFEFKLKSAGFDVHTATEGSEAVRIARTLLPDFVLVDINYPPAAGMHWDGFVLLTWLRRLEGLEKVPIIVISSAEASRFRPKALASGAQDFFQKPVNFPLLMARIYEILGPSPATSVT